MSPGDFRLVDIADKATDDEPEHKDLLLALVLEAVALVIVLVKRGTQLASLCPLFLSLCLRLGITESAHKATEMKILTSKCTAATATTSVTTMRIIHS